MVRFSRAGVLTACVLAAAAALSPVIAVEECGVREAFEMLPCIEYVNSTDFETKDPPADCCTGIQGFNNNRCFCMQEIIDYDPTYFAQVKQALGKCTSPTLTIKDQSTNDCYSPLPTNGFLDIKDLKSLPTPDPPSAPPPATGSPSAKKLTVDFLLSADPKIFKANEAKFLSDLASSLGIDVSRIKIKSISYGSSVVEVEIEPATEGGEISSSEVDSITNKVVSKSVTVDPVFGEATIAVAKPPAAGTPERPLGQFPPPPPKKEKKPLGDSYFGIPRLNPADGMAEYQGGFALSGDYGASLAFMGAPGFGLGICLLIVMILMLLVFIVSKIFGTCCKCCKSAFKPRPYTEKDVKIMKVVMVVFVILSAVGCFLIYANIKPLTDSTSDVTGALTSKVTELVGNTTNIANALSNAVQVMGEAMGADAGDVAKTTADLNKAAIDVNKEVEKAQADIDKAMDDAAGMSLYVGIVLLAVCILALIPTLLGWWRALIFTCIIISVTMILSWIIWGVLSISVVFVDDMCNAMSAYVADPASSDLSDLIPCLDTKTAIDTMSTTRATLRDVITEVNKQLKEYSGKANPYLEYLCFQYAKLQAGDMCGAELTPYFTSNYANFVCKTYKQTNKIPATDFVYPEEQCPFPTAYHSSGVGEFGTKFADLRCPYTSDLSEANKFKAAQCVYKRQIPSDLFDDAAKQAAAGQGLIDVFPEIEGLLQCTMVTDSFRAMSGPCDDLTTSLYNLWVGFFLISFGYTCLWVIQIVAATRFTHKNERTDQSGADVEQGKEVEMVQPPAVQAF